MIFLLLIIVFFRALLQQFEFKKIMRMNLLVFASIMVCVLSGPILLSKMPQNNVWDENFPNYNQKPLFNKEIPKANTNLIEMHNIFKQWNFVSKEVFAPQTKKTFQAKTNGQNGECSLTGKAYKSELNYFTNPNGNNEMLIPGNIVSSVSTTNILKGFFPVGIKGQLRNKMPVKFTNGISASAEYSDPNQYGSILQKVISQNIQKINAKPIRLFISPQAGLEKTLRFLNLPTETYEFLRIASQTSNMKQHVGRISIILFQQLFSASLDFKENQCPVEFFFNNQFNKGYVLKFTRWGSAKIPNFVEQVNYGRLLVVSCEDTPLNRQKIVNLEKGFSQGKVVDEKAFDQIMAQLINNVKSRHYIMGPVQFNKKSLISSQNLEKVQNKVFNWKNLFFDLQKGQSNYLEFIEPLGAKIRNILGQQLKKVETRVFNQVSCNNKFDMIIKIYSVTQEVSISIRKNGQKDFGKAIGSYSRQSTINITQFISKEPFEIRLNIKGRKLSGFINRFRRTPRYNIQFAYGIDLNGLNIFKNSVQNNRKRDSQSQREIIVFVDPALRKARSTF